MKLQTVTKVKKAVEAIEEITTPIKGKAWDFTNAEVVCKDIQNNLQSNHQFYDTIGDALKEVVKPLHGVIFNSAVKGYKFTSDSVVVSFNTAKNKMNRNTSMQVLGAPLQQIVIAGNNKRIDVKSR